MPAAALGVNYRYEQRVCVANLSNTIDSFGQPPQMITPRGPNLGRMLKYVGWPLALLLAWDVLIVLAYKVLGWTWVGSQSVPLALYGSAIGIVVGFRNNSAYDRWWEARKLWGRIVNSSRSLARQVCGTMHPVKQDDPEEARELAEMKMRVIYQQIAFAHCLRQQLRGLAPISEAERLLNVNDLAAICGSRNMALAIQHRIGAALAEAKLRGWIGAFEWQAMDRTLADLADSQGGAERIKNTPLPKQYDYFPMLFVHIFCILLPTGMVEQLGWFTPAGSTLVGFMFLALDKIGRDLEDPFDNTIFDVPMTAISTTIEADLRQLLGEEKLPEPITPVRGVLW